MPKSSGTVYLVGAGPGDPGLLTLRAAELLREADVVLYDYLASDATLAAIGEGAERIYVGKQGGNHSLTQDEINTLAIEKARSGANVVRLKGGDPFVFGRGGEEAQALHAAGISFEIVPGVTSAIAAPAYAGIPVTHRDFNTALTIVTGHEDPSKNASTIDWSKLADPAQTVVFLMAMENLGEIVAQLRAHGRPAQTPIAIVRDGTRPTQETLVATLGTIGDALRRRPLGAPAVAIVGEAVRLREEIRWFDAFPLFGRRVLVTRPAHQAADLAGLLYRRGAQPILAPTIELGPPDLHPERAEYAIDQLDRYDWIVFTSRNGVDAFWAALQRRGADARAIAHRKVAAIGAKTAQALLERGIRADAVPANYQAEDLAEALTVATKRGDRILVYRAQEARDVLQRTLEARQRYVEVVAAYKTTLKDDPAFAEKLRAADVVTFTSASTVAGFVHNLHGDVAAAREKSIACIGPVTAEAARNAGLHVSVVSESSTVQSLVDALEEALPSTGSASLH